MARNGQPGGTGAGGGNGGGNNDGGGDGGGGGDDEPHFTPQQQSYINKLVTDSVNAAVTANLGRKLGPAIKESLGSELGDIRETLAKMAGGAGQQQQPQPGQQGGENKPDPKVQALERQLAEMRSEREADQRRMRESARDTRIRELALAAKVDPNRMRGVVALLKDQVKFADDGRPVITVQRNGYAEDLDLDQGVGEFFKTDEGKAYLAPTLPQQRGPSAPPAQRQPGGAASGASAPRNAPQRTKEQAKDDRKQQAMQTLQNSIGQLLGGGNIEIG